MKLMVPTLMVKVMIAKDLESNGLRRKAGEIVEMGYGHALLAKALGAASAIVNEEDAHIEAVDMLGTYGGDCWFPHEYQTISHLADYLADVAAVPKTPIN